MATITINVDDIDDAIAYLRSDHLWTKPNLKKLNII